MFNLFNKDSVLLKEIVSKHDKKNKIKLFNENKGIFDIIKNFILENELILYGGTALNMLLPKKVKFYSEYELPDYDAFCIDARNKGIELAKIFKEKGYKYIEFKDAIHAGTYKLFVDFLPVLDLTETTKPFYNYLYNNSHKDQDTEMLIAPVELLKWSLYTEMASPESSIHRWEKLYKRLIIINRNIKIDKILKNDKIKKIYESMKTSSINEINNKKELFTSSSSVNEKDKLILNNLINLIKIEKGNIFIGDMASKYYTTFFKKIKDFDKIEVLSKDPKNILDSIKEKYKNVIIKKTNKIYEVITEKYNVYFNKKLLLVIYVLPRNKCFSFKTFKDINIGTIDTILGFYYRDYINLKYKNKNGDNILKQILFFEHMVNFFHKNPKSRFNTMCIGENITLIEEMKRNWDLKIKKFVFRP